MEFIKNGYHISASVVHIALVPGQTDSLLSELLANDVFAKGLKVIIGGNFGNDWDDFCDRGMMINNNCRRRLTENESQF